jgi:hypothetical protein
MNPIGQLITFIASVSIILYFLVIGYYLRRIMIAVERLSGTNQAKILECDNCGKRINLGVGFNGSHVTCPGCKARIVIEKPEGTILHAQNIEEAFP